MNSNIPVTRFAQVHDLRLAYDSFGDASQPPLLLVMGLGTQMIAWDEAFCAQLAERGYYVIRFDNRDIGQSTWLSQSGVPNMGDLVTRSLAGEVIDPGGVPYTLADMAADTVGLLDVLGIQQAHVVGASMGGAIAQEVGMRYPERVHTLVSIMATSGAPGLPPPSPAALAALLTPAPLDRDGYIARHLQVMQVLRPGDYPDELPRDRLRAGRAYDRGVNPAGYARQLAAIIASGSRAERLATLRVPTLVIHGDADPLVPIAAGIHVSRTVPGARMLMVPGMGHALPRIDWPPIIGAIAAHAV